MNRLIILIAKKAGAFLSKRGRGSVFPGTFALKLNKNIIKYFKLPKNVIVITGSNGKTTTSAMLTAMLKAAGQKVGNNSKGANLKEGIITALIEHSDLKGNIKLDTLILELDERYVKKISPLIRIDHLIVTNLCRDQLGRTGNYDLIFEEIAEGFKPNMNLIINADDPIIYRYKNVHKGKITTYSLNENKYSYKNVKYNNLDQTYCPVCHSKLDFSYFNYGNIGNFKCKCGYGSDEVNYVASMNDSELTVNETPVKLVNDSVYMAYNTLACFSVASEIGVSNSNIQKGFMETSFKQKRIEAINYEGKEVTWYVVKTETPNNWNGALEDIERNTKGDITVILGTDAISTRHDVKGTGWMWDVNPSYLINDNVKRVVCVGNYGAYHAMRQKHAGVDMKKVFVESDLDQLLEVIKESPTKKVSMVLSYNQESRFRKMLSEAQNEN